MRVRGSRLLGNFVPLSHAVQTIAKCTVVNDDHADAFRNLNGRSDQPAIEEERRRPIKMHLAHAFAAGKLLELVNKPLLQRPEWFELFEGTPLRDDSVGNQGKRWLTHERDKSNPPPRPLLPTQRWKTNEALPAVVDRVKMLLEDSIGFDLNELVTFLDQENIRHTLEATSQKEEPGSVPKKQKSALKPQGRTHMLAPSGKTCVIEEMVIKAWREAGEPYKPSAVYACLRKIVEAENSALVYVEKHVVIVNRSTGPAPYTSKSMGNYIRGKKW